MLWLPKCLRTDVKPDEPDLSRRAFSFGLVGAAVSLAVPAEVWRMANGSVVEFSSRDMRIHLQLRPGGGFTEGIAYQQLPSGLWLAGDPTLPIRSEVAQLAREIQESEG